MKTHSHLTPLISTKLHRPAVGNVHVHRQNLLNRLNQWSYRPLTLVCASAGYGKSSLVSCWLADNDMPSAWLSLDKTDNDLHLFLTYFLATVQTVSSQFGEEIRIMLNAPQLPPLPVLAACLINELDRIDKDFILAIDDYHLVQNNEIHELFEEILKHPPHAMHLVLVSRIDPPLSLAPLRARGQMTEIRTTDLRFSQKEITQFLQHMLGTGIEDSTAVALEQKTEGWITGLHLAVLSIRHGEDLKRVMAGVPANNRFVMDYLVSEILSQQPSAVQDCLLKTSILNRFCTPLCDAVCASDRSSESGEISGQDFLQLTSEANLFVIALDHEHKWFRFHHLFQEVLQRTLEQRFKQEEISQLHTNASTWFADNGFIEEALQHAVDSGDQEAAVKLVTARRHEIMSSEQWYRLERWLRMLPPELVNSDPHIVMLKAWLCETWMQLDEIPTHLNQIEHHFLSEPSVDNVEWNSLRAEFYALRAFVCYLDGDGESTIRFASKALKDLVPEAQSARAATICLLSWGHQMIGDLNSAYDVVYKAQKENLVTGTTYHSKLYLILAWVHWMAADLMGLRLACSQIFEICEDFDLPESLSISHHFMGLLHYLRDDLNDACEHLGVVVDNYHKSTMLNFAHSAFALALSYEGQGKSDKSLAVAETAMTRALHSGSGEFLHLAEAFQAELFLRQGQVAKARKWAVGFESHPLNPGYRFFIPQFTYARYLLAENTAEDLQKAKELLAELHDYYGSVHHIKCLVDVLVLQAVLHDDLGEEATAFKKLNKALSLSEPGELIRPFLDLGQQMASLLRRLGGQQPDLKYAIRIMAAFGDEQIGVVQNVPVEMVARRSSLSNQALVEPLTKRELDIMLALSTGLSNQTIAESLFISPETVKRHLYNIFQKFEVKNRQQALARARSLGIV